MSKGYPDVAQVFSSQQMPTKLRVQVDADHGGDAVTRKSTTGMVAIFSTHALKRSSNVQSTIGLSTAETEYYALVKGGSTGLGLQSQGHCTEGWTWQGTPYPNEVLRENR